MKTCIKCKESKPEAMFSLKYDKNRRPDSRKSKCRRCINREQTVRRLGVVGLDESTRPLFCEVCKTEGEVVPDHDHTTRQFRGWLCRSCNLALGYAKDDPEILRGLIDYLT
jgi:hypothetical protein